MKQTYEDQIVLVSGASRGIGQAIATAFAEQGAYVVGTATSANGADSITKKFEKANHQGVGLVLDIADKNAVIAFEQQLADVGQPTILVNNAGITQDNLLLRMKDDEWETVVNTNLNGVYRLSKLCLKPMMKARFGRIINITSVVGLIGNAGQTNYAATKAGVIGFTRSLAKELGSRGITVNAVAPGFIETDMTKMLNETVRDNLLKQISLGRFGQPEEIAKAVLFLASPAAAYITGQTLSVNGGMYMG